MTMARPTAQSYLPPPVPVPALGGGPVLSHTEWLATLKRQDMVRVRTHMGKVMPPAMVTNDTPCYVFVGRLKFHRRNGWQVARQSQQVYRMRLRLVRDEREFT
jgi:hypothetical protein